MRESKTGRMILYSLRTAGILVLAAVISLIITQMGINKENAVMVFMVGVLLITAFTGGYQYGFISSVLSVMIFNYFFTAPYRTFAITDKNDIVLIVFFLLASFISSSLTVRMQKQMRIKKKKEAALSLLYEMSEGFINVTGKANIIELGISYILQHTGFLSTVLLKGEDDVYGESDGLGQSEPLMLPVAGASGQIGELRVYDEGREISKEQELIMKAAANQIGIALDRELIYAEQEKIKIQIEKEHMKSSMLRSISHDFRTPLTGIIGDCGYLLEAEELDTDTVRQFAGDISEQALWLTKMMENILNMTRIESGKLQMRTQPEVVDDIVYEAVTHVIGLRDNRKFNVCLPDNVILADMDGRMMMQVLINLLDNAVKHTKDQDEISLNVCFREDKAYFRIEDSGDGLRPGTEDTIFQEFVSLAEGNADKKRGIGLGLAICREVVKAHNGVIWAENREEGGARFIFWIPAKQVKMDGQ